MNKELKKGSVRNSIFTIIKNEQFEWFKIDYFFIFFRFIKIFSFSLIFERSNFGAVLDIYESRNKVLMKRKLISFKMQRNQ